MIADFFGAFCKTPKNNISSKVKHTHHFEKNGFLLSANKPFYLEEDLLVFVSGTIAEIEGSADLKSLSQEVRIAQLYRTYGKSFYQRTDGLHLIIIFDLKNEVALISNNRYQATQLYYSNMTDGLYFAKSLKGLLLISEIKAEVHLPAIRSFVSNGFTISDNTQIKGIKKLLPTFQIEIKKDSFTAANHWQDEVPFNKQDFKNLDSKLDEYEQIYQTSLVRFIAAKNPLQTGTLLSGGHDTSWVTIQYQNLKQVKRLNAYTVTFPGWSFNEEAYAKNIANKFNANFYPIPFTSENLDQVVDLIRSNEEPVVGSSLPLHVLAQNAAKDCDLMLGGDGGDTLWGEYFPVAEVHKYISKIGLTGRKSAHRLAALLARTTDWERFWELEHVLSLFTEETYYDDFMRKLCTYRHFGDEEQQELFKSSILQDFAPDRSIYEIKFDVKNFANALIEGKLFNAFYTYQSFHTTKSMEHFGMELYLPTIQKDVIKFITNLPDHWVNGGTTLHRLINSKSINRRFHKKALARYLKREEIYNRSFDIPWTLILNKRPEVLALLEKRLIERDWFNPNYIKRLFSEFSVQKIKDYELLELKNHGYRIFTLLSLEVWATEFLDGRINQSFDARTIRLEEYFKS